MMSKTIYFCAGWFTDKQNKAYQAAMTAIKQNPTIDVENSYVPLQHQYKNIRVDEHPEYLHDKEWATATFKGDCLGVTTTDATLAVYIPDEEWGKPINLMSWGFADNAIKMSELASFNFNQPSFNFYEGAVY